MIVAHTTNSTTATEQKQDYDACHDYQDDPKCFVEYTPFPEVFVAGYLGKRGRILMSVLVIFRIGYQGVDLPPPLYMLGRLMYILGRFDGGFRRMGCEV